VCAGYVTEVYGEEWMLVFVDEDDYAFIGGDLLMLSTPYTRHADLFRQEMLCSIVFRYEMFT
jgi:hypothetical protein